VPIAISCVDNAAEAIHRMGGPGVPQIFHAQSVHDSLPPRRGCLPAAALLPIRFFKRGRAMNLFRACLALALLMPLSAFAQERAPTDARRERSELADERFRAADANHDNLVSRAEANKSLPNLAPSFDKIDVNKDGQLSRDELRDAGEKMNAKP